MGTGAARLSATRLAIGAIAAVTAIGGAGHAAAPKTPVVVELFTSEGCSSCPPADQLLIDLVRKQPVSNAEILAVSEHVDYWDRLGWKDPFSDALFTMRQNAYGSAAGSGIYTPQLLVDGRERLVGSDRAAALAAIKRAASRSKRPLTLQWIPGDPLTLTIKIEAASPGERGRTPDQVTAFVVEDDLTTKVALGENAGRTLTHARVARRLIDVGHTEIDGSLAVAVPIHVDDTWKRGALGVVVVAQRAPAGVVVAAAQQRLPAPANGGK